MFHRSLLLASTLLISGLSNSNDLSVTEEDNPNQPLTAIQQLKSLKNLQDTDDFIVPTIQNLMLSTVPAHFVQVNALPMVDLQLNFDAGSVRDAEIAAELYGIAHMSAQLLNKGTVRYSATEIARQFEDLGSQLSVQAQRDNFVINLRMLSDPAKIQQSVNLLLEIFNQANFASPNIERLVENNQLGQKQQQDNPSRLMQIQFYHNLYAKHPYGRPVNGGSKSIAKISPEHLKQFREKLLVRENLNIALTGDMTVQQAKKLAQHISQNIPSGQAAAPIAPAIDLKKMHIQHLTHRSSQAHVMMGHLTTSRKDPDRLALEIANRMLGNSSFNSLLMQELRIKRGYTYGVSSSMTFPKSTGLFSISYSTEQAQLLDSINVAHQTLIRFITQPIDSALLAETKSGMLKAFPMNFASNSSINAQIAALGSHQESTDYLSHYKQRVSAISAQDVQNAVRKHLRAEGLTFVIVSQQLDQTALRQQLQQNLKATDAALTQ